MKLPTYDSMTACNAATGIPMPVLRAAKRAGCAAFDSHSRVNLELLLRWLFRPDGPDGAQIVDWHQRYKRAMALGAEQELAKERGDLIDAHVLGAQLMAAGTACKTVIAQAIQESPIRLAAAGDDIADNRTVLREVLDKFFAQYRDAVSPFMINVEVHSAEAEREIIDPPHEERTTIPKTTESNPSDAAGEADLQPG